MEFHEFYFVFLRKINDFTFPDDSTKKESFKGHFEFQRQEMLSKRLLFSGPLDGTGGLYFFSTQNMTVNDLMSHLQKDPLVKIGLFVPEVHKSYVPSFMIQVKNPDTKIINDFFSEVINSY